MKEEKKEEKEGEEKSKQQQLKWGWKEAEDKAKKGWKGSEEEPKELGNEAAAAVVDITNTEDSKWGNWPVKWWNSPRHCSSCTSPADVSTCVWSWSCIHTWVTDGCGRCTAHSRSLHTPSEQRNNKMDMDKNCDKHFSS